MFMKLQEAIEFSQTEKPGSMAYGAPPPPPYNKGTVNQGYPRQSNKGYPQSKIHITAMIQPVPKSKKGTKSISKQVNLAMSSPPATTKYLCWSELKIGFNRADHPRKVPRPGHAPMVLKAQIRGFDVGRVFMDASSGINLVYARTLKGMNISLEWLQPIDCSFYGIVLGSANHPLGKNKLDVCFGDRGNCRREKLKFEVMDWPPQYHGIRGRPTFARFMAVLHYAYLVLKIAGPNISRSTETSRSQTYATGNLIRWRKPSA
jgi:hypothetical protein